MIQVRYDLMHRKEWVERLRGLGIRVKDVAREEGLNVEGMEV